MQQADTTPTPQPSGGATAEPRYSTAAYKLALMRLRDLSGMVTAAWGAFDWAAEVHPEANGDAFNGLRWVLRSASSQADEALAELRGCTGLGWHTPQAQCEERQA